MSDPSSRLTTFLAELRRRRVFRVAVVYAGVAFIIFQIVDATFEPLHLPDWAGTLVVVLLALGFPIAVGLAWAFDITEKGVVKTPPKEEAAEASGAPRITIGNKTLAVVAVLAIAVAIWSWWGRSRDPLAAFEHSVVVMPFDNLTGDESFDIWEKGMAMLLITDLSASEELYVLDSQTLFDIINSIEQAQKAQVIPTLAREVATRTRVKNVILGDILKAGDQLRLQARLMDARTGQVTFSHFVDGKSEDDFFTMAQELADRVKNHLEIEVLREGVRLELGLLKTSSAEAFRQFVNSVEFFQANDYPSAIQASKKAIEADSNFLGPKINLVYFYGNTGQKREALKWLDEANKHRDTASGTEKYWLEAANAALEKKPYEAIKWEERSLKVYPQSYWDWNNIGWNYYVLDRYAQAVRAYEKALELASQLLGVWTFDDIYYEMGEAYHGLGNHNRELEVYKIGLKAIPKNPGILHRLAICYMSRGDTARAALYLERYKQSGEEEGWSEAIIANNLGGIYLASGLLDRAQAYYRRAMAEDPDYPWAYNNLAYLLIDHDLEVDEGIALAARALELEPENYTIMDTYGWGLYKQGRYAEALEVLERAWELLPFYDYDHYQHLQAARKAAVRGK